MTTRQPQRPSEKLRRVRVPAIDRLLGSKLLVLDDGFVRVIDYMGSDASIVQAARISYGTGTKRLSEDRGLIRYLMRHRHTTPFEMCEIKLHVRVPMDCWRQWIRHRTANVNEYSTRYSIAIDSAQETPPHQWRAQATGNRQGSEGFLPPKIGRDLSGDEARLHRLSNRIYKNRLTLNVAREQARKDLPISTYTEAYWKIDLHNLLHFLELRMDPHAQTEIRAYAGIIGHQVVRRWCPISWEAFLDYRLHADRFSRIEIEIAKALIEGQSRKATKFARTAGMLPPEGSPLKRNREREECEKRLKSLGLHPPWVKDSS